MQAPFIFSPAVNLRRLTVLTVLLWLTSEESEKVNIEFQYIWYNFTLL